MKDMIRTRIEESIEVKRAILSDDDLIDRIARAAEICIDAFRNGNKVLLCGNGGSAADAQHIAAELSGRFKMDREPLYAEALHVNTSYITAVANDYGFSEVFRRAVEGMGKSGDVLIALSTSGNSENVVSAAKEATEKGMSVIGFSGANEARLKAHCEILIAVPSKETARVQEAHILIGHVFCALIERHLFKNRRFV